ncbi:F0F1 ATP synthase subunit B [Lachnobacterium bovis]|uniref:ATP synthase subunit b n=1 Tax=Lachnobacterium bovis DSM 14045 TaxID=1122142 RepID=A0A1H3GD95_9FIRM|nr:F0F1 ATP synthase subunit B [Lachnobacterium bovis]MBQ1802852.1 F0F1 ATP synthase subunit B [Lachnobacterium sp.]SDY01025.1 F-type H+-transporting ATPase subunit b [Lachnobacterium bovis DSM 14045]
MLNIQLSTIILTIINVLIMYVVIKKLFLQQVMDTINARDELIKKQFEDARVANEDADRKKEEYSKKLESARTEAEKIVSEAKDNAQKEKELIIKDAKNESQQIIAKAKENIVAEQKKAKDEVSAEVARLAIIAARKIIKTGEQNDARSN